MSDKNGKVTINTDKYRKFTYNHAYALKEIRAPAWYNCESEPHYFMLTFSNTEKYPVEAPSNFNSALVDGKRRRIGRHRRGVRTGRPPERALPRGAAAPIID